MKEKASFKESGEDQIPRVDPDAPGLAPGEELAIDPVGGDEIDPIRKWWDEAEATSRDKARNRRLEELEAGAEGILDAEGRALPRRRKRPEPLKIEVEDIPGLPGPKEASTPVIADESPVIPLTVAESAGDEDQEDEGLSLEDFAVAPLKRHAREEGEIDEFDLSELFGSKPDDAVTGESTTAETNHEDQAHTGGSDDDEIEESPEIHAAGNDETVVLDPEIEDPGFDLGDLLEPLAAKEVSALHFEFPDFEDEAAPPVAETSISPEAKDTPDDEVFAPLEAEVETESEPFSVIDDLPEIEEAISEGMENAAPGGEIETPVVVSQPEVAETSGESGEGEPVAIVAAAPEVEVEAPLAEIMAVIEGPEIEPVAESPEQSVSGEKAEDTETETETIAESEITSGASDIIESAEAATEDSPAGTDLGKSDSPIDPKPLLEPDVSPSLSELVRELASAATTEKTPEILVAPLPAAAAALPEPRKKAGCWTVFATLFFFATLLLVLGLGVAGWFAWSRLGDFETELTSRVRADLEEKGIYLDYGDWGYQFPRGLVFEEVTIFDDATRERPLIKAAGVGLNVDLLALAKAPGELSAGQINLQDSSLSLFEAGNLVTTIEGIDGEILAGREDIRVDRLSALLGGWQVTLNGVVTLPQASAVSGEKSAPSADGGTAAAPLTLDLSAFKALEPWLALGGGGGNAPALDLTIAMDADQPDLATIEGTIHGREVIWQGVDIASVTATFNVVPETGELSVPSFQIGYGQGFIGGRLAIDTVTQRLRIEQLQSTVDVLALLGQYKPAWVESWKSIRLIDAPSFQITGEVPFEDPAQADLKIRYDHRQGLVVAVEKGELPLRDLRGNFTVNRGSLETNDGGFGLFGGSVQINGATRLTDEARPFNGLIEITGLSMKEAATFFGKDESGMSGRLSFVFRGVGYREITKIRGGGTLRVEEAVIPDFPVLGEIQDYVGRAVPAFGVKGQGNVTGAYIIESGVLVASDLTVANTAARIVTNGSVNLSSQETTFTSKAELVPSLASATGLTDKAITFEGKGLLSDPAVTLKTFPLEFASVSLGSILGTSPRSLGTLQIVPGVEEAVGAFADQLGGPGVTIHPEVTTFFKSLLGEEATAPEEAPVPQVE
jgi:hypothetical protein